MLDVDLELAFVQDLRAESTDRAIARARIDAWFRLIHATCFSNFSISTGKIMKCVPCTANCEWYFLHSTIKPDSAPIYCVVLWY